MLTSVGLDFFALAKTLIMMADMSNV